MQMMKKHPVKALLLLCYLLWFVGIQVVHLGGFIINRVAYANGTLQTAQLSLEDFTWNDFVEKEGHLLSTGYDPQLILLDTKRRVDTVYFQAEYSQNPRLVTVFWAKEGQGHSLRNMAYPQPNSENSLFYLSPRGVQNLRIDPGTVAGNEIVIREITINEPRPWYAFFSMKTGEWVTLIVFPGLIASGISLALAMMQSFPQKRKGARKHD